jgi:TrmH family RNA methyltransferase
MVPYSVPQDLLERTRIVLHHPFFPENVGAAARAMRNMGLTDLRTVAGVAAPDHPNAQKLAVGSAEILERARVHAELAEALEGVTLALGTTSHPFPHLRVLTPREAAQLARAHEGDVALVFGNEKNGLAIGELRQCHAVVRIPGPVKDASLNLAQAVMVLSYEWLVTSQEGGPPDPLAGWTQLAPAEELDALVTQLEDALHTYGFYKPHNAAQRRSVLRRVASRLRLDAEEASLLRGLVSKLELALRPRR